MTQGKRLGQRLGRTQDLVGCDVTGHDTCTFRGGAENSAVPSDWKRQKGNQISVAKTPTRTDSSAESLSLGGRSLGLRTLTLGDARGFSAATAQVIELRA